MAEEKKVDELLDELLEGLSPEEIMGKDGLVNELTKRLMERALEGELTDHLGYEKNAFEGHNGGNSRNGRTTKRVKTHAKVYRGFRFPGEIISHGVWLHHRFSLNLRDVEELLAKRGVMVSYETIRQWRRKFGPEYAQNLRHHQGRLGDIGHLDEVFKKIRGERHYLWRAVDQDGDVIDILVQRYRNARGPHGWPDWAGRFWSFPPMQHSGPQKARSVSPGGQFIPEKPGRGTYLPRYATHKAPRIHEDGVFAEHGAFLTPAPPSRQGTTPDRPRHRHRPGGTRRSRPGILPRRTRPNDPVRSR